MKERQLLWRKSGKRIRNGKKRCQDKYNGNLGTRHSVPTPGEVGSDES